MTEFKSHSGLKVGETKPMLVRKVSSGVCVYAPADDLVDVLKAILANDGGKGSDGYHAVRLYGAREAGFQALAKIDDARPTSGGVGEIIEGCNGPMALARELRRMTVDRCSDAAVYASELCQEAATFIERTASEPADGWRPIESAPRDGTAVLAGRGGEFPWGVPHILAWLDGPAVQMGAGWYRIEGRDWNTRTLRPTHWMPLPAPPSATPKSACAQEDT